jgi:hypothetical protein
MEEEKWKFELGIEFGKKKSVSEEEITKEEGEKNKISKLIHYNTTSTDVSDSFDNI